MSDVRLVWMGDVEMPFGDTWPEIRIAIGQAETSTEIVAVPPGILYALAEFFDVVDGTGENRRPLMTEPPRGLWELAWTTVKRVAGRVGTVRT